MLYIVGVVAGVGFAAVALLVLVVAVRPAAFRIFRTITINAPPAKVFEHVYRLKLWEAWSPWAKIDSAIKIHFEGPEAGLGAVYRWSGNNRVGEGRMEVVGVDQDREIAIKLAFFRPVKCNNDVVFTFEPAGAGTKVSWAMTGKNNFLAKAFDLLMNMDKMVGHDFDRGLFSLKQVVEKGER